VCADQTADDPLAAPVSRTSGLGAAVRRDRAVQAVRQESDPGRRTARGDDAGAGVGIRSRNIVVIDDEPDQVDLTVALLQASGHRAIGSTDGAKAVALVTGQGGEVVVVLDFMLSGMTGGDVCSALRAEPATRQVRIVLLSATPEREIRLSCTQYDTYLSKPTSHRALSEAIESV
jgi:CheY-like chemotaxis protein